VPFSFLALVLVRPFGGLSYAIYPPQQLLETRSTFETELPRPKLSIPKALPTPNRPPSNSSHGRRYTLRTVPVLRLSREFGEATTHVECPKPRLQDTLEGQLNWNGVSLEEVSRWEREHPGVMENKKIRQEYNFPRRNV